MTRTNVIEKYRDWLVAGVERFEEHREIFKDIRTRSR